MMAITEEGTFVHLSVILRTPPVGVVTKVYKRVFDLAYFAYFGSPTKISYVALSVLSSRRPKCVHATTLGVNPTFRRECQLVGVFAYTCITMVREHPLR